MGAAKKATSKTPQKDEDREVQATDDSGAATEDDESPATEPVIDLTEPSSPTTRRFYANLTDL